MQAWYEAGYLQKDLEVRVGRDVRSNFQTIQQYADAGNPLTFTVSASAAGAEPASSNSEAAAATEDSAAEEEVKKEEDFNWFYIDKQGVCVYVNVSAYVCPLMHSAFALPVSNHTFSLVKCFIRSCTSF
jgi:hypothetical protein